MTGAAQRTAAVLGQLGTTDRTTWQYRTSFGLLGTRLHQAKFDSVAQQQVDTRHGAQRLERAAEDRHPPGHSHKGLKFDRSRIKDLALHDKSGTNELPPPKRWRPRVVFTD